MTPYSPRSIRHSTSRHSRCGFTLIELLITIGIIAALIGILLPTLSHIRKRATRIAMASDLQAIESALDQYKADFGDYPRVEYTPGITSAADRPEPPTGAQILCWALIGPAPIYEAGAPANQHPKQDGADGPGFRTRISKDSAGNPVGAGKVFGPYLPADKFHMANPALPTDKSQSVLLWTLLDSNNIPILYAPASPKHLNPRDTTSATPVYIGQTTAAAPQQTFIWDLTDILGDLTSPNTTAVENNEGVTSNLFTRTGDSNPSKAAVYRVSALLGDTTGSGGTGLPDGRITDSETPAYTGPFLLWMAGPDEKFGPEPETTFTAKDISNCDDVTNFNQ